MARIKIAHILSRTQFRRRSHAVLGLCVVVISNGHCQSRIITKDQQCDEDTCEFTIIKVVIRRQEVCFWNSKIHQYKYAHPQIRMHKCTKTNTQKHVRVHSNQSGDYMTTDVFNAPLQQRWFWFQSIEQIVQQLWIHTRASTHDKQINTQGHKWSSSSHRFAFVVDHHPHCYVARLCGD